MSISPRQRKPASTLTRSQPYRGSGRRHAASGRPAIDRLVKEAIALLASCQFDAPRTDLEAAMDYLTFQEDFMALLDLRAESLLHRRFAGPGDSAFEEILVDALTLVQARLTEVIPGPSRARVGSRAPN